MRTAFLLAGVALMTATGVAQIRPTSRPTAEPWTSTAPNSPVARGATLEKLADGFAFTEGATSDVRGDVFFVDQPNDRILKWDFGRHELSTWMQPSGHANGMSFDAVGNLIACADENGELWSIAPDKTVTVLLKDYRGKHLNGPNDVFIHPDGGMYLTDPFYKRNYWRERGTVQEQDVQGVYFLSPDRKTLTRVIDDLQQPNGIIGTPDGKTLYVSDIRAGKTYAYAVQPDGSLADKRLFNDVGSDGMTVDSDGNVYTTSHNAVQICDRDGKLIETIPAAGASNCCLGGPEGTTLFITARDRVYGLKMTTHRVGPQ